jgi:hypothetical protein
VQPRELLAPEAHPAGVDRIAQDRVHDRASAQTRTRRGVVRGRALPRATPITPAKTPAQTPPKTLTPPTPPFEAGRQRFPGRNFHLRVQPRAQNRQQRNRLGVDRLLTRSPFKSFPSDDSFLWRPTVSPIQCAFTRTFRTPRPTPEDVHKGRPRPHRNRHTAPAPTGLVPTTTHPYRKVLWRPIWGQPPWPPAPRSGPSTVVPGSHLPTKGLSRTAIGTAKTCITRPMGKAAAKSHMFALRDPRYFGPRFRA